MTSILLMTVISCDQAVGLVNKLQQIVGLNYEQKIHIVKEIMKVIPDCPVIIKPKQK